VQRSPPAEAREHVADQASFATISSIMHHICQLCESIRESYSGLRREESADANQLAWWKKRASVSRDIAYIE